MQNVKVLKFKILKICFLLPLLCLSTLAVADIVHGLSMHGDPKYAADFKYLDHVNPDAPKGGDLHLAGAGSFDNLNSIVVIGTRPAGLEYIYDQLLQRVWDEPFSL